MIQSHRDLIVWQKAIDLVDSVYSLTQAFPVEERYGLVSQLRRAAVSIPANIAEGRARGTRKDYRNFLIMAYGSCAELETHIVISRRLAYSGAEQCATVEMQLSEVSRMLNRMIASLKADT